MEVPSLTHQRRNVSVYHQTSSSTAACFKNLQSSSSTKALKSAPDVTAPFRCPSGAARVLPCPEVLPSLFPSFVSSFVPATARGDRALSPFGGPPPLVLLSRLSIAPLTLVTEVGIGCLFHSVAGSFASLIMMLLSAVSCSVCVCVYSWVIARPPVKIESIEDK